MIAAPGRQRPDQELDHRHGALVGLQQIPATIDDDGGEGLLLAQHVVERAADRRQRLGAEIGLTPGRRVTRSQQQLVGLAQRHVERRRQAQDHLAAGLGAAELEEAQMTLRAVGRRREPELRKAASLAPQGKSGRKADEAVMTTWDVVDR